jgi:hypothetical protein
MVGSQHGAGPSQQMRPRTGLYIYKHQGGSFPPDTTRSPTAFNKMDKKQSTSTLTSILAGGLAGASETVVTVSSSSPSTSLS